MFKKFGHAALASLLGASMLIMPTEVSAITILPVQRDALAQVSPLQDGLYQDVQYRNNRARDVRRSYLRHRNGRYYSRYRYRHGPYRYYRDGYWYDTPWWALAIPFGLATGAIIAGTTNRYNYGSAHVRWCSDRYRSYNPRTNTWVGNSGRVYQCNSPYDGR
jgi:BA14K-like protein